MQIESRTLAIAKYIIITQSTIRTAAAKFGISKSTIHKDLQQRLPYLNPELSHDVNDLWRKNIAQRHLRGGASTKLKWMRRKENL